MLRLEHLFDRLGQLLERETPLDHHFALATMFEIIEVASRADLKSDLLKELDRHRNQLGSLRGNPQVSQPALEQAIGRIDAAFDGLNQQSGKAGQSLSGYEWLNTLRSRIGIPGGTCEFDLPAYFAWQHLPAPQRRADLGQWTATLEPLALALQVLMRLLRDAGTPQMVAMQAGLFQQSLPQGRSYQLLRLRLPDGADWVPEISGHRLLVSVRMLRADAEGRMRPVQAEAAMELTLCA